MIYSSTILVEGKHKDMFASLLKEEDFDFSPRTCFISLVENSENLEVHVTAKNFMDYKIASSALLKSLEIIEKTLNL